MMPDERWVEVPGARLWAASEGVGPSIVLLHAGIVDGRVWEPFVPMLTEEGYRVVWYDARGHHRSRTEDVEFRHVDDLRAVLDAFEVDRAALVGNSRGGEIALEFALAHPDRVPALVMLASGIPGLVVDMTARDAEVERQYEEIDAAGDIEALTDFELALWGAGIEQPVERLTDEVRAFLRPMIKDANDVPVRGTALPPRGSLIEELVRLPMPVVFVHGGLDFAHTEAHGRVLEDRAPRARLVVWPDVAHLVAVERPAETATLVLDLLRPLGDFG